MIKLTFFEKYNIPISWGTIIVGRKLKLVNNAFIEDFATKCLIQNDKLNNPNIIELAYGIKDDYLINQLLEKIVHDLKISLEENDEIWNIEKRKWRFMVSHEILNKNYSNKKILEAIESVYWDFDHPKEMNEFLIFMSHDPIEGYDFQKHSAEENFAFMVQRFKKFLLQEQQVLSTHN